MLHQQVFISLIALKTIPLITASILTAIFFYFAFKPGQSINLIAYSIHEAISPGGADETSFIRGCDILCGIILFWIIYKVTKKIITY